MGWELGPHRRAGSLRTQWTLVSLSVTLEKCTVFIYETLFLQILLLLMPGLTMSN